MKSILVRGVVSVGWATFILAGLIALAGWIAGYVDVKRTACIAMEKADANTVLSSKTKLDLSEMRAAADEKHRAIEEKAAANQAVIIRELDQHTAIMQRLEDKIDDLKP